MEDDIDLRLRQAARQAGCERALDLGHELGDLLTATYRRLRTAATWIARQVRKATPPGTPGSAAR